MNGLVDWRRLGVGLMLAMAVGCSSTRMPVSRGETEPERNEPTSVVDLKIDKYRRLVSEFPNEPKHRERLAAFLWQDGKATEAVDQLQAALAIDRNNPKYLYMMARIQQDQGNFRLAETNFKKTLELMPDGRFTGPHYDLAWLYLELDDPLAAEREFRRCLEIDPFDPLPHYYLGKIAYDEFRDAKRAIEHWEQYLAMNGRRFHSEVHRSLVGLQPNLGRVRYEPAAGQDKEAATPPATGSLTDPDR